MPQLLISDTNVIVDLEDGLLISELFQLPYQFAVPDILYAEELEEQHSHLLGMGLEQMSLNSASMQYTVELVARYRNPSFHDCLALALARQEGCPLVTGDRRLREAAEQEGVEKRGTVWIIDQLLDHGVIGAEEAALAVQRMREAGSRLPWAALEAVIAKYT